MISKRKIALMTKLTLYKKGIGQKDFEADNYFRYDYISKKNLPNIFFVFLFTTLCVLIYRLDIFYNPDLIFDFDQIKTELINSGWFIFIVVIIYGIIGFITYNLEYTNKIKRLDLYYSNLDKLNKF